MTVGGRVFTIAPGLSFVDALARGLMDRAAGDPLALAEPLILLPTRRACRALREAFLRLSEGRPLLLPRMRPLGELDEDEMALAGDGGNIALPPAVPPLRRQLLLARQILALGAARGGQGPSADQAATLAAELGRLLDSVQTEGLDFAGLQGLVPDVYAAHWQITLEFLKILTEHWPGVLRDQGFMDAGVRRIAVLTQQAEDWARQPPPYPVVAAGSTGSIPATAALLKAVAGLPRGAVVLPGLDQDLDPDSWAAVDHTHPQCGLKHLLDGLGVDRARVRPWVAGVPPRVARARLVSQALRPAATTEAWRALPRHDDATALDGVSRLDCSGPRDEAGAIALMMREALEDPDRTAALVTPDRNLARRVAAELRRWGIVIDDSAGRPLAHTLPGVFLLLTARMVADDFAPHATLAALKHPLAALGASVGAFRARVRRLEVDALRGPRPAPGVAGLRAALGEAAPAWLDALDAASRRLAGLVAAPDAPLAGLVRAHVALVEALAADDRRPGAERLWQGDSGEAASAFLADLLDAADTLPAMAGRGYPALLETLMQGRTVRPLWGGHPRLHIWGPLEARLQHADLVILGGLNEGTWPPQPNPDPWMSRPMREAFGLPLPERRIGLSAHDFAQAMGAPRVVLARALKVEGAPTVPSRWLLRLDAVLEATGLAALAAERGGEWRATGWSGWHALLDRPDRVRPGRPPAPCPPLSARPRRLSVTNVETWMRDPYAIYAKYVLKLTALDPIDADPGAADYGSYIHQALDSFLKRFPDELPANAVEALMDEGRRAFGPTLARPGVWAFWWPRFGRIAAWFVAHEAQRRHTLAEIHTEVQGSLEIPGPYAPFTVTAKADRVDRLHDGSLVVIDYKTGAPPTKKEVAAGYAPQLALEAAIAQAGGFAGIAARPVSEMLYWRLKGGDPGGEEKAAADDPAQLAAEALSGLARLVAAFDDPATAYESRPHPERAPRYSDYLHLARVKEWASLEGDEE